MSLNEKVMLTAGVPTAIGALLRCLALLGLLILGVSGAWVASLVASELYRPTLVIVTLLFFALALRRLYLPQPHVYLDRLA